MGRLGLPPQARPPCTWQQLVAMHAALPPLLITPVTLDAQDCNGLTALQLALRGHHYAAATVLVAAGASWYEPGQDFAATPLPQAFTARALNNGPQLAEALLKRLLAAPALAGLMGPGCTLD
jgi:hypothetical protein